MTPPRNPWAREPDPNKVDAATIQPETPALSDDLFLTPAEARNLFQALDADTLRALYQYRTLRPLVQAIAVISHADKDAKPTSRAFSPASSVDEAEKIRHILVGKQLFLFSTTTEETKRQHEQMNAVITDFPVAVPGMTIEDAHEQLKNAKKLIKETKATIFERPDRKAIEALEQALATYAKPLSKSGRSRNPWGLGV